MTRQYYAQQARNMNRFALSQQRQGYVKQAEGFRLRRDEYMAAARRYSV